MTTAFDRRVRRLRERVLEHQKAGQQEPVAGKGQEPVGLDGLTVDELKTLAKERGIELAQGVKKAGIIEALEAIEGD